MVLPTAWCFSATAKAEGFLPAVPRASHPGTRAFFVEESACLSVARAARKSGASRRTFYRWRRRRRASAIARRDRITRRAARSVSFRPRCSACGWSCVGARTRSAPGWDCR
jgi:hypothetical protein